MAAIDYGTGSDTASGDYVDAGLRKVEGRAADAEARLALLEAAIGSGPSLTVDKTGYLTSVSAGALIATLSRPFGIGTIFATVGASPAQLAIASGGRVVAGSAASADGGTYDIKVRASSADGKREVAETLRFTATAPVVTPAPSPTPSPTPTPPSTPTPTPPPSGSPAITSAPADQQFSRSARYSQATANRSGTWDIAGGSDAALYEVLDAARGIYGMTNAAVAGAATLGADRVDSYTRRFTPADGTGALTQAVTNTVRPIGVTAAKSEFQPNDLSGTVGTRLTALPGWQVANKGGTSGTRAVPVLTGDGKIKGGAGGNDADWAVLRFPAVSAVGSVLEVTVGLALADYSIFTLCLAAAGYDNCLLLPYFVRSNMADNGFGTTPRKRQGGVESDIQPSAAADNAVYPRADGTVTFRITRTANALTVTVLGATANNTGVASSFRRFDLSSGTWGDGYGFGGDASHPTMGEGIRITALSYVNAKTDLALADAPAVASGNVVPFSLVWAGAKPVAGFEHRFRLGAAAWSAWTIGESSVEDGGTATYVATYPTKGDFETQIRMRGDTPVAITVASTMVAYADENLHAMAQGGHPSDANYFVPFVAFNDWGKATLFDLDTNALYVPHDGITTDPGMDTVKGALRVDTITTEFATTMTKYGTDDEVRDTLEVVSTGGTTHTVRVRDGQPYLAANGTTGRIRGFSCSSPPGRVTVTRANRAGIVSPEWIAAMALTGARGFRTLDWRERNKNKTWPLHPRKDAMGSATWVQYPFEFMVMAANALAALDTAKPFFLWHVVDVDVTDAEAAAYAAYFRDNALPNVIYVPEFGCECPWNYTGDYLYVEGLKRGWKAGADGSAPSRVIYRGGGDGIGMAPAMQAGEFAYYFQGGVRTWYKSLRQVAAGANLAPGADFAIVPEPTGTNPTIYFTTGGVGELGAYQTYTYGKGAAPAMQAGEVLVFNVAEVGLAAYRAKQAVPAGADVGINAYFERMPGDGADLIARKFKSRRFNEYLSAWVAAMPGCIGTRAAPGRVRPALMGMGGLADSADLATQFAPDLAASEQFAQRLYYLGAATYYGQDVGHSATVTEVGEGFRAAFRKTLLRDRTIAQQAVRMGYTPAWYEGSQHNALYDPERPAGLTEPQWLAMKAASDANYYAWRKSSGPNGPRAMEAEHTRHMRALPGLFMRYTTFGISWGVMDTFRDTANPLLLGLQDGLAN